MHVIRLSADFQSNPTANASFLTRQNGRRIVDAAERRAEASVMYGRQQFRSISRASASDIVTHVQQTDSLRRLATFVNRFCDCRQVAVKIVPHVPHLCRKVVYHPISKRLITVSDDNNRRSHLGDIGVREPKQDTV